MYTLANLNQNDYAFAVRVANDFNRDFSLIELGDANYIIRQVYNMVCAQYGLTEGEDVEFDVNCVASSLNCLRTHETLYDEEDVKNCAVVAYEVEIVADEEGEILRVWKGSEVVFCCDVEEGEFFDPEMNLNVDALKSHLVSEKIMYDRDELTYH